MESKLIAPVLFIALALGKCSAFSLGRVPMMGAPSTSSFLPSPTPTVLKHYTRNENQTDGAAPKVGYSRIVAGRPYHNARYHLTRRQAKGGNPIELTTAATKLYSLAKNRMSFVLDRDKNSLTKAYRRGSYLFLTLAAILLLIPDRTITVQLATKFGGAAGYAIAGGLCHILAGANEKDRLTSDTYMRLNLGLLGFSAFGFLFKPAEAGFFFQTPPAIFLSLVLALAQAYGVLLSFLGWKRGADPAGESSMADLAKELKSGTISSVKGLRVENAKAALAYRNCLLLVGLVIFSNIMEAYFTYRHRGALRISWFEISLYGSAAARLFMIATMIYTLKDAAERDRLTGTTFIQLNLMLGVWAITVAMGQAIYPLGVAFHRGAEMFAFSVPFVTKAWKALIRKEREKTGKKELNGTP